MDRQITHYVGDRCEPNGHRPAERWPLNEPAHRCVKDEGSGKYVFPVFLGHWDKTCGCDCATCR